jgi:TIR domain
MTRVAQRRPDASAPRIGKQLSKKKGRGGKQKSLDIFISHIHEECAVALVLKRWLDAMFPSRVTVFVSSAYEDSPLGRRWMNVIDRAVNKSRLVITLISPQSRDRMWINLEAGWALGRGIEILPICHSGATVDSLSRPYSDFGSAEIESKEFPERLLQAVTHRLHLKHEFPVGLSKALGEELLNACKKSKVGVAARRKSALASRKTDTTEAIGRIIIRGSWRLFFNPRVAKMEKSKRMRFGKGGTIFDGRNDNEASWQVRRGCLEFLNTTGGVHGRFKFDRATRRFYATNDPDTGSVQVFNIRDQYMIPESKVGMEMRD